MSFAPRGLEHVGHLDQRAAGDREVVDDQDVLAFDVADDFEHLGPFSLWSRRVLLPMTTGTPR